MALMSKHCIDGVRLLESRWIVDEDFVVRVPRAVLLQHGGIDPFDLERHRVVPCCFMNNRLAGWQQKDKHNKQHHAHPSVVVLGKPGGFVEYQWDTEITTKEEQQGKQQGEDEEPQGEILEHAKDEC